MSLPAKFSNFDITIENVLKTALKTPGVKIDRAKFLNRELSKYFSSSIVAEAIRYNPAKAGISRTEITIIADQAINHETLKVTGLSAAASAPGGAVAAGAAVADIVSYFAFILRIVQKISYLYGFPEFSLSEDELDEETVNHIMLFLGVMYGVSGATTAIKAIADTWSKAITKQLVNRPLTKGIVYPIVKKAAKKIGFSMTKQVFADGAASVVPLIGAALSGGLTYAMFKPRCKKLQMELKKLPISDPMFYMQET